MLPIPSLDMLDALDRKLVAVISDQWVDSIVTDIERDSVMIIHLFCFRYCGPIDHYSRPLALPYHR